MTYRSFPPDLESELSGSASSPSAPASRRQFPTPRFGPHGVPGAGERHGGQPKGRQLNPRFVAWLMGWAPQWTSVAPSSSGLREMEWFRYRRRMRLSCLLGKSG